MKFNSPKLMVGIDGRRGRYLRGIVWGWDHSVFFGNLDKYRCSSRKRWGGQCSKIIRQPAAAGSKIAAGESRARVKQTDLENAGIEGVNEEMCELIAGRL